MGIVLCVFIDLVSHTYNGMVVDLLPVECHARTRIVRPVYRPAVPVSCLVAYFRRLSSPSLQLIACRY